MRDVGANRAKGSFESKWRFLDSLLRTPILNLVIAAVLLSCLCCSQATADAIDFEGFVDSTVLTNQYPGLTFTNVIVLSAGIGLNDLDFPSHSGTNVASDESGPLAILFGTPILSFSGYFTYFEPLTITAFDSSNNPVDSAFSLFTNNLATLGDPGSNPNELLQVSFVGGISKIVLAGDPSGGSFTMDDLNFQPATPSVPEPTTSLLILTGLALPLVRRKLSKRS